MYAQLQEFLSPFSGKKLAEAQICLYSEKKTADSQTTFE